MELIGGAYAPRSVLGGAQRCINLFPERNRKDGPQVMTHYQRPGLRLLEASAAQTNGRGIWRASNGTVYCCVGQGIYVVNANNTRTQIGTLTTPGTNIVSFADNGVTMTIGDGSQFGYQVVLGTNAFSIILDPTNTFAGTIKWGYIDGFMLWVLPNSNQFGSTLNNQITFNGTYVAGKTGYPDKLQTLYVNRHVITLFGSLRSEIWYDAGNPLFPFAILPGAYIEQGCLAPYSVASHDTSIFWLGQSEAGVGLMFRQQGYQTKPISNYAISYAIRKMAAAGADLTDAVAYTYTQDGHVFYVITFVSGDQTWVYDDSINEPDLAWHQRGWTDANGVLHRERLIGQAWGNGLNLGLDWQTGDLYAIDPDYYFDYVGGVAMPINYTRTFPQIYLGRDATNNPKMADGLGLQLTRFAADLECGNGPVDANGLPPSIGLRWSPDRGRTFGQTILQSTGNVGEYATQPKWAPLGIMRYPVLELNYSFAGPAACNGGWVDAIVANQ